MNTMTHAIHSLLMLSLRGENEKVSVLRALFFVAFFGRPFYFAYFYGFRQNRMLSLESATRWKEGWAS